MKTELDVVILGGGLAGLCLARLLRLEQPQRSVLTLDTGSPGGRKVGEALVEIGAMFLDRRLQLGSLLRRTQLPKNGLRFWFDDGTNLPLTEASEDGPMTFGYWQTFQLDRDTLEHSLLELNLASGVNHLYGVREISTAPGHTVRFTHEGQTREVTARWLVDASGVAAVLSRQRGLLTADHRVDHGGCWARFANWRCPGWHLEAQGDRRRVIGKRLLSTNHLMREGYWIWWIPLASGLMSVGLVYDHDLLERPPRTLDKFIEFLRQHRPCKELMADADPVDFGTLTHFAHRPRHYFGEDRTAAIGLAGGFVDPYYSSGVDFIALGCEFLCELIRTDNCAERRESYNRMMSAYYEQCVQFASEMQTYAAQALRVPIYRRDIHLYWNLYAWPYFSRDLLSPRFIRAWLSLAEEGRQRSGFFLRVARQAYTHIPARSNRGQYTFNQLGYRLVPYLNFERQMGHPVDLERSRRLMREADAGCLLALMDAVFDGDRSPVRRPLFEAALARIDEITNLQQEDPWPVVFSMLSEQLGKRIEPDDWSGLRDLPGFGELPVLERLEDLAPMGPTLQPGREDWTFDHTAWPIAPIDWRTVYEYMEQAGSATVARLYRAG